MPLTIGEEETAVMERERSMSRCLPMSSLHGPQECFGLLVKAVQDYALLLLDPEGMIVEWNEGAVRMIGYSAAEVRDRHFSMIYPPEDVQGGKPERELAVALAEGRSEDESWRVRKDGSRFWGNEVVTPLRSDAGELLGFFKITRDLTERKQLEDALRASEERQRRLIEDVKEYAIFMLDPNGKIATWNSGAERILGYQEHEILGRPGSVVFTPEDRERGEDLREQQTALTVGQALDERWHLRKDGSRFWGSGVLTALWDEGGQLRGFTKVMRDNTERRRLEAELEQRVERRTAELAQANHTLQAEVGARQRADAARQELLRRLLTAKENERARLSHELHNQTGQQLTGLILVLNQLQHQITDAAQGEQLQQLAEMAQQIARDQHRIAWELRPTSLDDLGLAAALSSYVQEWSERTGIAAEYDCLGLERVRVPLELETTLFRIVQEALTNVLKHAQAPQVCVVVQRNQELTAVVEDKGVGFDVEAWLASPAAATRLGLLGMRERAALVGGTVTVESTPGVGTTVYVRLPLPAGDG